MSTTHALPVAICSLHLFNYLLFEITLLSVSVNLQQISKKPVSTNRC